MDKRLQQVWLHGTGEMDDQTTCALTNGTVIAVDITANLQIKHSTTLKAVENHHDSNKSGSHDDYDDDAQPRQRLSQR